MVLIALLLFFVSTLCSAGSVQRVRIGVPMNFPSFSYQDEGDKEVRGYSVDIINIICAKLGKDPSFLAGRSEDLLTALRSKDLDLIIWMVQDDSLIQDLHFLEINIFAKQYSFIYQPLQGTNFSENFKRSPFVVVRGPHYLALGHLDPGENLIQARTVKEALFLVNSGRAREYIDFSNQLVTYLIGRHGLQNIRQAGVRMVRFPLTILTKKENTLLNSALSQALGEAIKSGELDKVREKWLGESYSSYLFDRFGVYLFGGTGLILVMISSVFLWNWALKRRVKKVTLRLQETEQRYRQLIESSPDMVFLINREGFIRLANTSACDRLGVCSETLPGFKVQNLIPQNGLKEIAAFLSILFLEKMASAELILMDSQGNQINVEIAAAILRRGSDAERLACCFARDITKRKRIEQELIRSERLATMGKMAAGVAHEVNNPLGIILSHTEELLSGELNPKESHESLNAIRRNAVRAGNITETLLNQSSSVEAGKEIHDFAVLALECVNFLKPRMKKIRALIKLEKERYWIQCNESQIQQVLINILLNSIESMEENGTIRMQLLDLDEEKRTWNRLLIEDSGKGIREEDRPFVLDPFFTHGKKGGVGLGLFVAERIITKHGGRITVDDSNLGGAAMLIDLPYIEVN